MVDIAKLGFDVDSRTVKVANDNLKKMGKSAEKAGRSSKKFETAAKGGAKGAKKMAKAVQGTGKSLNFLKGLLVGFAATVITAFSIAPVFAFQNAIAEVSTLVDTATFNMTKITDESLKMSAIFGGSAAQQAGAFYQIISAGANSASEATDILTVANKLAVGGVTEVGIAVDGLTNILNAYGSAVEGADAVSDALFIGMKAGKTTIGELSGSLGKVAPLAVSVGVGFDELVASISALTKGGIKTTEAVTGVRAILAAVAKPTSEAVKLAKQLGLEFNAAALEAKGFGGFLDDLVKKTGGSTDKLALLFGGVEALIPIMALSGQAGIDFIKIMGQMEGKAGATTEAFNKMSKSPGFQAKRLWGSLTVEVIKLTSSFTKSLVPAMKNVADNMKTVVKVGLIIISTVIPGILLGIGALGIALAGALGPIGLIASAISALVTAVFIFRREVAEVMANILSIFKVASDGIVRLWAGAMGVITSLTNDMANAVGAAAIGISNNFLAGIEGLINGAIRLLNKLIDQINKIPKVDLSNISEVSIGRKKDTFTAPEPRSITEIFSQAASASKGAGTFLDSTIKKLRDFAKTTEEASTKLGEMDEITKSVAKTTEEWHAATRDGLKKVVIAQEEFNDSFKNSFKGFFADIRQGTSLFGALGNAINSVVDKLLEMAAGSLFESIFFKGSSGAGILSLFGGLFSHGGVLGAGKFGIAGEEGPELIRGPASVTPISKIPANNNRGIIIQVDARGAIDPAAVEAAVIRGIDRATPQIIAITERRAVSRTRPSFV